MNILFITPLYPETINEERTKQTFALYEFVSNWREKHNIYVVKLKRIQSRQFKHFFSSKRELVLDNVPVLHLPVFEIKRFGFGLFFYAIFYLKQSLKGHSIVPDVVITHYDIAHLFGQKIAKYYTVPHVAGIHKRDVNNLYRNDKRFLSVFSSVDLLAFRSPSLKKRYHDYRGFTGTFVREITAASGIDQTSFIKNSIIKRAKHNTSISIITVARLKALKQIDMNLRVLSRLTQYQWHYTVIGDGREYDNLLALTVELGLSDRVTFTGYMPHDEIPEKLALSDLFLMVSHNETFGLVYLEAMASACVVIGAKGWGVDGIIQDGVDGFLCDPESEEELSGILERFFTMDMKKRDSLIKASLSTVKEYTVQKQSMLYLQEIEKIVSDGIKR